jgi:DnaJ-class molecular chaperone
MTDYYATLGVQRTATADEIKRAYRRLASQHHPDKGGDTKKFQEIEEAYRTLSDVNKKQQYDNPSAHVNVNNFGFGNSPFNFDEIFAQFGTRFNQQHRPQTQARLTLWINLIDVARSGPKTITVSTPHGSNALEINIPQGIEDGDSVQYAGIAPGGVDLIITFRITPDPLWQRQGPNLITKKDVSIWDLILGGAIEIRDLQGTTLQLTIPQRSNPGTILRVRGRGLLGRAGNAGDLLIQLNAQIPVNIDSNILDAIRLHRDS